MFSCNLLDGDFVKFTLLFSFSQLCYFCYKSNFAKACLKYDSKITCLIFRRDYVIGFESERLSRQNLNNVKVVSTKGSKKTQKKNYYLKNGMKRFYGLVVFQFSFYTKTFYIYILVLTVACTSEFINKK